MHQDELGFVLYEDLIVEANKGGKHVVRSNAWAVGLVGATALVAQTALPLE